MVSVVINQIKMRECQCVKNEMFDDIFQIKKNNLIENVIFDIEKQWCKV